MQRALRRRPARRSSGFTFIEILVVMSIIAVLATMVVAVIPMINERAHRTKSMDNVKSMLTMMLARRTAKVSGGWPPYNGKDFVLSLVATRDIDIRNKQNIEILFSPGDQNYTIEKVDLDRYKEVNKKALKTGTDFHELTSYAGRRNRDKDYLITSDQEKKGTLVICDDDDGPLHHSDGLICGYTNGAARFQEWDEFDMPPFDDPDHPEPFLGDAATNDELMAMWGQ
jgi:prepilin-type N-terminal cleavage/methylation domain-containing protein